MMYKMALLDLFLIICIAPFGLDSSLANTFDVMKYGAAGDGHADDSQAFIRAWQATCGATGGTSILNIPGGKTFLLNPLAFEGPCKSPNVHVHILGNLVAPSNKNGWSKCPSNSWLYFSGVDGLNFCGNGQINGQGSSWWSKASYTDDDLDIYEGTGGCDRPTALRFHRCNGLQLSGVNHLDSPRNHISISTCNGVSISQLRITAPEHSPNTDGIDISGSTQVIIRDSVIGTGDDCIAINSGCSNINITGISCGPGHGISIGSLGAHGSHSTVEWIRVQGCRFAGTTNGGRVKTWPGGTGYARNIFFEKITLSNVKNPIIIDQHYCNGSHNCPEKAQAVQVSDVHFTDVRGTSASKAAITLDCSSNLPCNNIMIDRVDITSSTPGSEVYAACQNARGRSVSTNPKVPCLS